MKPFQPVATHPERCAINLADEKVEARPATQGNAAPAADRKRKVMGLIDRQAKRCARPHTYTVSGAAHGTHGRTPRSAADACVLGRPRRG